MDITPDKEMIKPTHQNSTQGEAFMHMFEGIHFKFPTFKHDHLPILNVNAVADERLTIGQTIADGVASIVGSWRFIIIQSTVLAAWIALNVAAIIYHWDPYPFILLNLVLSFQAAY